MDNSKEWQGHQGQVLDSAKGFKVIECKKCNFKHIVPIPNHNELKNIYKNEYYLIEKPLYLKRHRQDLNWWNLVYAERYDIFEKHLAVSRRRILDIGSGPGFFLLHGKKRGWQALGIEPSRQAARHSRNLGVDIIEDFLTKEVAKKIGKFDVIHMSEVLEHIPEPKEMLLLANDLLSPGGLLCVTAPNDYNPIQYALKVACNYKPWWVGPPHHINYFDFGSLSCLLIACGFKVIFKKATFPIDIFLLMGDNYIGNDRLGRKCHHRRMKFEINLTKAGLTKEMHRLYEAFASLGIGREVMLIGKKMQGDKKYVKKTKSSYFWRQ